MEPRRDLLVVHIKQPRLEPTETFVTARIVNPICRRPIPVLTHEPIANGLLAEDDVKCIALNAVSRFGRFHLAIDYRLGSNPFYYAALRDVKPSLIHAHFSGAGLSVLKPAKYLRIPLIINFYGIETKHHLPDPLWRKAYITLAESDATFVCSSDAMKRAMVAFGFPEERVEVIRCGVDTRLFDGCARTYVQGDQLRLLSVARLHSEKGLEYLLEACALLLQRGFTQWSLRIVGDGPLKQDLMKQRDRLGLHGHVTFVGVISSREVAIEMRNGHLFVLPSLKETQGVVFQEAQATRMPVIGTAVEGVPEGVIDGVTGFLVRPRNAGAIADRILHFAHNPELFKRMGEEGRTLVLKQFTREKEYERLAELYRRVVRE